MAKLLEVKIAWPEKKHQEKSAKWLSTLLEDEKCKAILVGAAPRLHLRLPHSHKRTEENDGVETHNFPGRRMNTATETAAGGAP
jgi:hypothetical protein